MIENNDNIPSLVVKLGGEEDVIDELLERVLKKE